MSRSIPFLQRRGHALNFRIAVPADLQLLLGQSEITKALHTNCKKIAEPMALEYAAGVKRAYFRLREEMCLDVDKLMEVTRRAKEKIRIALLEERHEGELAEQQRQHKAELKLARLETENSTLQRLLAHPFALPAVGAAPASPAASGRVLEPEAPLFSAVVRDFLTQYPKERNSAMYKKHCGVLPLLLEVVGNKRVTDLKQADINGFFKVVGNLPPRWRDACRKRGITVIALSNLDTEEEKLGPKTFEDTYKATVRAFLKVAKRDWMDLGFPTNLTTEGIEYRGQRESDGNKQRAFTEIELQRLFSGPEMTGFSIDPTQAHKYWLPYLGLYTGARVNELCQLNPHTDVLQDMASGIWYFMFDETTDTDERIIKSVKNKPSTRKVPIHSQLVLLGFLRYLERVKATKAKLIFPAWAPGRGRASSQAEKWFRQLLRDLGLRDETKGAKIVGMHAFRHTIMNRAFNLQPSVDVTSITGHAGEKDTVVAGYQGELSLINKQKILESIQFAL